MKRLLILPIVIMFATCSFAETMTNVPKNRQYLFDKAMSMKECIANVKSFQKNLDNNKAREICIEIFTDFAMEKSRRENRIVEVIWYE